MKKLLTVVIGAAICLSLSGCGSTKDEDSERLALLESRIAELEAERGMGVADNTSLRERIEQLENELQDVQANVSLDSVDVEISEATEELEEPKTNYKWGEYPDFVHADDVLDYWLSFDCNKITVLKPRQVDIYTGGDQPSESWKVDSDIYIGGDGRHGMWYFEEAGETCLLLEDSVVRLLPDGETEVFLDGVVGYGGWDSLMAVYQLNDGVLTQYEQTSGYRISTTVISSDVEDVDVYSAIFVDPMLIRKTDGVVYYFGPYGWEDDVAPEELGLGSTMNMTRLQNGDTSVMRKIGTESLAYYRQWVEDYRIEFIAANDPDMLYPLPALLAEFAE